MSVPDFLFDFEVFSTRDLKAAGTFAYAADASTRAIVLAYAIGDEPARAWHADGKILDWNDAPDDLRVTFNSGGTGAAWNAGFDTGIWNYATLEFPFLEPERVIDPMIQAGVSNLPTDLESASRYLGGEGKQKDGKKLIKLFCVEGAKPEDHPEEWQRFLSYARQDVEAMRDVYRGTRPLPLREWEEYWAFEHINRRGVEVDVQFIQRAAALVAEDAVAIGRRLNELTDGVVTTVGQVKRLAPWMHDHLVDAEMREVLLLGDPGGDAGDDDDSDDELELSVKRDRITRICLMLEAKRANGGITADEAKVLEAATLRMYGGGTSPKKFARLDAQQVDGVLRGQYRFAGAGQTGRLSSKGAQIQNLVRDVIDKHGGNEAALVDMIADGCSYADLVAANPVDMPATRKLALLVRPGLVAGLRKAFVGSDWNAIEARTLPWLAASPGGEAILDVFRQNDADPTRPDIYMRAAADILRKPPEEITESERQIGKVTALACIAEGELVLTDVGMVPIEKVTTTMRVWDGVAWVSHAGVIYRGVRNVFTYDGLTATGDHVVFATQGTMQFSDAAARGARLVQSGAGRAPIRLDGNHLGRTALCGSGLAPPVCRDAMRRMWRHHLDQFAQPHAPNLTRLPTMFAAATDAAVARSYSERREGPLYDENTQAMDELRRTRHRISLPLCAGSRPLGFGKSRRAPITAARIGPDQQQRSLRAWKPALGDTSTAELQHAMQRRRRMGIRRRRVALCVLYRGTAQAGGANACGNPGASGAGGRRETQELAHDRRTARVFDILSAGPRHRFTVSGRLVHNCGFGGSVGALKAMALNYRLSLDDAKARRIVDAWRSANPWAREFWTALWDAAMQAWEFPGTITTAGRAAFLYRDDYLGGALFMALPSGRLLTYPRLKWRDVDVLDKDKRPTGEKRRELSFRRAHGRAKLWFGTLVENLVQGTAADLLRATVTRIESNPNLDFMKIRLTTHDEIVVEVDEARADEAKAILRREMLTLPAWAAGLPLASEESVCPYYTKSKAALQRK